MRQQETTTGTNKQREQLTHLLPLLKLDVNQVTLPDTITTTVTASSLHGKKSSDTKKQEIPFAATIHIATKSPKALLRTLGLNETPERAITVELYEKDETLYAKITNIYEATERRAFREPYNPRIIKVGDEVAPYCRATEDSIEYEYRTRFEDIQVRRQEIVNDALSDEGFSALVSSLQNDTSEEALTLLKYFKRYYPEGLKAAQEWLQNEIQDLVSELQEKAKNLRSQANALNELKMPK